MSTTYLIIMWWLNPSALGPGEMPPSNGPRCYSLCSLSLPALSCLDTGKHVPQEVGQLDYLI